MAILLQVVILLGLGVIVFVGVLVAFRAERNWATICLLAGTILMAVGWTCGAALGVWLTYQWSSPDPSGPATVSSGTDLIATLALVARIVAVTGVLSASAGFIGLVSKFAGVERRAGDLEVRSAELQNQLAGPPSAAFSPQE